MSAEVLDIILGDVFWNFDKVFGPRVIKNCSVSGNRTQADRSVVEDMCTRPYFNR